jgi:hypothetical protein
LKIYNNLNFFNINYLFITKLIKLKNNNPFFVKKIYPFIKYIIFRIKIILLNRNSSIKHLKNYKKKICFIIFLILHNILLHKKIFKITLKINLVLKKLKIITIPLIKIELNKKIFQISYKKKSSDQNL